MLKKLILFFCLGLSPLLSKEYFSLDAGLGVGYRQDRYKTAFHDPLHPDDPGLKIPVLTDKGSHIRSVALEGFFKMLIMKYFFLRFDADYAWPKSGTVKEVPIVVFGPDLNVAFPEKTRVRGGKLYDILGSAGLAFNLLPSGIDQKLLVVPQGGYSFHYQQIKKKKSGNVVVFFPPINSDVDFQGNLDINTVRTKWYGPFVGGDVSTDPNKCFYIEAGYFFHYLKLLYKSRLFVNATIPGVGFVIASDNLWNGKINNAYAQQVRGRIAYCFTPNWKIALSGNYYSFNGRKNKPINYKNFTNINGDLTTQKRVMRLDHSEHFYDIFLDLMYHY